MTATRGGPGRRPDDDRQVARHRPPVAWRPDGQPPPRRPPSAAARAVRRRSGLLHGSWPNAVRVWRYTVTLAKSPLLLRQASVSDAPELVPAPDEGRSPGPSRPEARLPMTKAGASWRSRLSGGLDQSRSPALADIIGARRMWTVAMISSGSIPYGYMDVVPRLACPS